MRTEDILNLDYRDQEGKKIIQKALRKMKPFGSIDLSEDIPLEKIEKIVGAYCRKYRIMIQYISPTYMKDEVNMYACSIKTTDNHMWLGNAYGTCLYELMAKTAIKMFIDVKKHNIQEQDWDEFKEQKREKLKELLGDKTK